MRNNYMTQEVARVLRKFFGPPPEKLCRQTCPQCDKRLVNIYRRGNDWKCRQCWEVTDNGNE